MRSDALTIFYYDEQCLMSESRPTCYILSVHRRGLVYFAISDLFSSSLLFEAVGRPSPSMDTQHPHVFHCELDEQHRIRLQDLCSGAHHSAKRRQHFDDAGWIFGRQAVFSHTR